MRAFIALELPESVRTELAKLQQELARARADVKWVEAENLHVTLRFLGDISPEQQGAVERLLERVARQRHPFDVGLSHVGAFPSVEAPRVVWVDLEQGKEELSRLVQELEEGLSAVGVAREARGFVAHVTLGRVRSPKNRSQLATRLQALVWNPPALFRADRVTLFESVLSPSGPRYTARLQAAFSS